jgi:rod shape-determining protein MreD
VGRWALVLTVIGFLAGLAREAAERSPFIPMLVAALIAAGTVLLYAGVGVLLGDARVSWPAVAALAPSAVLYDVLLTPLVVLPILGLARRVDPDPVRR